MEWYNMLVNWEFTAVSLIYWHLMAHKNNKMIIIVIISSRCISVLCFIHSISNNLINIVHYSFNIWPVHFVHSVIVCALHGNNRNLDNKHYFMYKYLKKEYYLTIVYEVEEEEYSNNIKLFIKEVWTPSNFNTNNFRHRI